MSGLDLELHPLTDFPQAPDVVEDGLTYRDNAVKKARTIAAWSGQLTLAEDSGLEVTALGGQPGIYTARFGGPGLSSRERCLYLLERLRGVPDGQRQAVFRCVAVLMDPSGRMVVREGRCAGMIGHDLQGEGGFGYDPLFRLPEQGCTLAELAPEKKDMLSHRAQAIRAMIPLLTSLAQGGPWTP
ncbi:MAG TPA: non-canonical purine NTP pyrophosphatase [Candidatus Tectomicrobia bacterium]|nr:non-canonical purine NTP pyrophosphatase [Candidatus Tectomicrobia bacterium]